VWCRAPVSMVGSGSGIKNRRSESGTDEVGGGQGKRGQYEGVLMLTMVAMIKLGKGEAAKRVEGLDWVSRE
jgi:hypothetical protein